MIIANQRYPPPNKSSALALKIVEASKHSAKL